MRRLGRFVNTIEETIIALLLAGMTLVTFSQVVARYVFNSGWVAALELTVTMFAWLVLFGISYGLKIGGHLGVDAVVRLLPKPAFRAVAVLGCAILVVYAGIFFYGSCGNPFDTGKLCGAGYVGKMAKVGLKTEDLDLPRWAVYSILPIGMVLLAYRSIEAAVNIVLGRREALSASHEAEDLVRENQAVLKE